MVLVLCSCSVVSCPLVSPWRLFIIAKGLFIVAREQSTDNSVCLLDDAVGLVVQRLPAALGACLPSRSQAAWRLPRPRYARQSRLKPTSHSLRHSQRQCRNSAVAPALPCVTLASLVCGSLSGKTHAMRCRNLTSTLEGKCLRACVSTSASARHVLSVASDIAAEPHSSLESRPLSHLVNLQEGSISCIRHTSHRPTFSCRKAQREKQRALNVLG